jgi:hypothetical protein
MGAVFQYYVCLGNEDGLLSFLGKACSNFFDLKQAIAEECRQPTRVITNCIVGSELSSHETFFIIRRFRWWL